MDLELLETGNGGDIVKNLKDLSVIDGFQNMAYLALFGGNPGESTPINRPENKQMFDWWGNNLFFRDNVDFQFNSLTEQTLMDVSLTSSGAALVEQSVKTDLEFMKDFADLEISVSIISDDQLEIKVLIDEPDNEQNKEFVFIWDATQRELPSSVKRESVVLQEATNLVLSNVTTNSIDLAWDSNSFLFVIERSLTGVGPFVEIAEVVGNTYTDDDGGIGLDSGVTYFYRVKKKFSLIYTNIENATTIFDFGNALDFDGVDDFVAMDSAQTMTNQSAISFWFKYNAAPCLIIANDGGGGNTFLQILGTSIIRMTLHGVAHNFGFPTTVTTGVWHQCLLTRNGTTMKVYLDGVESTTGSITTASTSNEFEFIGKISTSSVWMDGILDEIAMWGTTTGTAQDAIDLYNGGVGVDSDNIIADPDTYYKLNESGTDVTAIDSSGNSNDGTLNSFPASGMWVVH